MYKKVLLIISSFALGISGVFWAWDFPFTDVPKDSPIYESVKNLYDQGVISDSGDHLFRPNDPMKRDFYVSLTVGVGCKKCETPSTEDIVRYQSSPFVDLGKTNPYYYCIAYAADEGITQGYSLDTNGQAKCEANPTPYTSQPFCGENTISRIEAAAILLRRANLWNDSLNQSISNRKYILKDVTNYWYGYAEKWIDATILKNQDGNIFPDQKITRGEFAQMAAKILDYNQCSIKNQKNSLEGMIGIIDASGKKIDNKIFSPGEVFNLIPITSTGSWNYEWRAKNPNTGEVRYTSWNILPGSNLGEGSWNIELLIRDPATNKIVSNPSLALNIGNTNNYWWDIVLRDPEWKIQDFPVVEKWEKNTLNATNTGTNRVFEWTLKNETSWRSLLFTGKTLPLDQLDTGSWHVTLNTIDSKTGKIIDTDLRDIEIIDYNRQNNAGTNNTLTNILVADPLATYIWWMVNFRSINNGNLNLIYRWDFGDGVIQTGNSTNTHTYSTPWTYTVTLTLTDPSTGMSRQSTVIIRITGERDTDGDGVYDSVDACPAVYGTRDGSWCPAFKNSNYGDIIRAKLAQKLPGSNDSDGDWVQNGSDFCPYVEWSMEYSGCPSTSPLSGITKNICLANKASTQWIILGQLECSSCPCDQDIEYQKAIRSCDILFPSILSEDQKEVFSRWSFYLVP